MAWKLQKFNADAKTAFTTMAMGKKRVFVVMGSVKDEKSTEDNFRMV